MSDSTTSKMMTLKSSNGVVFVVPETVAKQSKMICHIIEVDASTKNFIRLNVTARILAKVIKYCSKHVDAANALKTEMTKEGSSTTTPPISRTSDGELRNWDMQFVDVDQATLFGLMTAAHYLGIKGLLDATCERTAEMIRGINSPEEI